MNIKEAKNEIKHTLLAYLRKNEKGGYTYPLVRQRPILLMGPPGIGKTAIMEQIAEECQVGLVAYTITHHTRQSAVGLPKIVTRNYGGKEMDITEYTMSEIIASVYECMERTGKKQAALVYRKEILLMNTKTEGNTFTKKIGQTVYVVRYHFNEDAKETMQEKINRMLVTEASRMAVY